MAVITTEKLSADGRRAGRGRRPRAAARRRRRSPAWSLEALEANGALVFRGLHLDDETQVAFSRKLGKVEKLGQGEHPEIFRVTLDPAKNPPAAVPQGHVRLAHRRLHRRHPDHGHDAQRPRRGRVRRRDRVRQHATPPTTTSTTTRRRALESLRVVHTIEASQRLHNPDPVRRGGRAVAQAARQGAPAGVDAPVRPQVARARRHRRPRRRHGRRRGQGAARRTSSTGPPPPTACTATSGQLGDVVIWDNRGVLHRACPYDPTSPRDMHRTTFAGDEPIQ